MKRHKSLVNLSHDHHHGLLLAQLIKKDAPAYKGLPTDISGKIDYLKNSWENELKFHFENEEKILFPAITGKNKEVDSLIDEILSEHKQIKKIIKEIENSNDKISELDALGHLLETHIRKEERKLFQKIQGLFPDELDDLKNKIPPANDNCKI